MSRHALCIAGLASSLAMFGASPLHAQVEPAQPAPTAAPPEASTTLAQASALAEPSATKPGQLLLEAHMPSNYELSVRGPGMTEFEPLCTADCIVPVRPGSYEFGLSRPGIGSWQDPQKFDLTGPSRALAVLQRERGARVAGGVIVVGGAALGLGLLGRGFAMEGERDPDCSDGPCTLSGRPQKIAGAIVTVAAAVVGTLLLRRKDHFHVEVSARGGFSRPELTQLLVVPTEPPLPPAEAAARDQRREQAEGWIKQHSAEVRACINETPATLEVQVSGTGSVASLQIFGDAYKSQQDCLSELLQHMTLPAGVSERIEIDVQPALR